jgi:hypothetical protein
LPPVWKLPQALRKSAVAAISQQIWDEKAAGSMPRRREMNEALPGDQLAVRTTRLILSSV